MNKDITIRRVENGVIANVRHIAHHSPTGFEMGYGGSGPADLALAIVDDWLINNSYDGPKQRTWCGVDVFILSLGIHHRFKETFLSDRSLQSAREVVIDGAAITEWMEKAAKQTETELTERGWIDPIDLVFQD